MKKTHKKKTDGRPFTKRTDADLDKMSPEFYDELVADTFGHPTGEAKARLRRAQRKPWRPRIGAGSKIISVTVEQTLLRQVDRIAKRRGTSRASLIARGLRTVLKEEGAGTR